MIRPSLIISLAYALVILATGSLLGPTLVGHQALGFRDVRHFYTPLYEYVALRQSQQWIPLWNPLDQMGMPLIGESTTAIFYPVRWLVYAVAPNAEIAIAWYVATHLMIAAIAIHFAAKSAGAGRLGCGAAIIAYPLSGPIFFLIHNPPFLVGAAWLPFMIAGGLRLSENINARTIALTAIAMAMPVLGGDPQSVVHAVMLGMAVVLCQSARSLWRGDRPPVQLFLALAMTALIAIILSAPQIAGSWDWTRQSGRLAARVTQDHHHDFAIGPWNLIEYFVANFFGGWFPVNTRWSSWLVGERRVWAVSLYGGAWLAVFLVNRWLGSSFRSLDLYDAMVPIGILFSMSLPYQVLHDLVPGYAAFRYPAKWLPVAGIGLCITIARQIDSLFTMDRKRFHSICFVIIAVLVAVVIALAFMARTGQDPVVQNLNVDRFWGQLDIDTSIRRAFASAWVSIALVLSLYWVTTFDFRPKNQNVISVLLLFAFSLDLWFAARSQVLFVAPLVAQQPIESSDRWLRVIGPSFRDLDRAGHFPGDLATRVDNYHRVNREGRWHLMQNAGLFNSSVSIRPQRIDAFWQSTMQWQNAGVSRRQYWDAMKRWLGIDSEVNAAVKNRVPDASAQAIRYGWFPAWRRIQPLANVSNFVMRNRMIEVASGGIDNPIIESAFDAFPAIKSAHTPVIKTISIEDEQMVFDVSSETAGLFVFKGYQDGNWRASLATSNDEKPIEVSVHRVDFLLMGVFVPSGAYRVHFYYQPWWLWPSVMVAIFGWGAALGIAFWVRATGGYLCSRVRCLSPARI